MAASTLLLLTAGEAPAQAVSSEQKAVLVGGMQAGMRLPAYLAAGGGIFRAIDIDMDGRITEADRKLQEDGWPDGVWRPRLEEILRHDLNFDGIVTQDEAFAYEDRHAKRRAYMLGIQADDTSAQRRAADVMLADRNGDGRIEWDESFAHVRSTPVMPVAEGNAMRRVMDAIFSLAGSDPSCLSRDRYEDALRTVFNETDSNKDGLLSEQEIDRLRAGLDPTKRRP